MPLKGDHFEGQFGNFLGAAGGGSFSSLLGSTEGQYSNFLDGPSGLQMGGDHFGDPGQNVDPNGLESGGSTNAADGFLNIPGGDGSRNSQFVGELAPTNSYKLSLVRSTSIEFPLPPQCRSHGRPISGFWRRNKKVTGAETLGLGFFFSCQQGKYKIIQFLLFPCGQETPKLKPTQQIIDVNSANSGAIQFFGDNRTKLQNF
ncbi:hypothetical protein PHJA_000333600 [Phtheirospermum japonicum]|uniref:Uncharacterized protein n=1 Tax=Phtheirospermum japonicum TaxID=374723 RepID=A0A830BBZ0_9LAMI|nr:hypothetical protein PHJA_000333600 [Phtheirospermum japonicum]